MQEKCGLLSREAFSVGSLHIFAIIAVPCTKNIYGFEFDDCKIQERRGVNSSNNGRALDNCEVRWGGFVSIEKKLFVQCTVLK